MKAKPVVYFGGKDVFRAIWLILAFLIAAAAAYGLTPIVQNFLVDVMFAGTRDLSLRDAVPAFGIGLALFAILSALLGPALLVAFDIHKSKSILNLLGDAHPATMKTLIKACEEVDYLIDEAEDYTSSFRAVRIVGVDGHEMPKTTIPAARFFPPKSLANRVTFPILFWTIAIALIAVGIGILLQNWLVQPDPTTMNLKAGIFDIAMCLAGATMTLGIIEALRTARISNATDFLNHLDRLYYIDQAIVFETALSNMGQSLRAVEDSFKSVENTRNENIRTLLQKVLEAFIADLNKTQGAHFSSLDSILKETVKTAQSLSDTYQDQLKQLSKGLNTTFKALKESENAFAKNNDKAVKALQDSLEKHHKALGEQQQQLIDSLEREEQGSEAIGRAAEDMLAASKASRETVERFITLAERLREVSRGIQSPGIDEDRPAADKATTKRLSAALRDLKRAVDGE